MVWPTRGENVGLPWYFLYTSHLLKLDRTALELYSTVRDRNPHGFQARIFLLRHPAEKHESHSDTLIHCDDTYKKPLSTI